MLHLFSGPLGRLGTDLSCFKLSLPLELGVVQTASVAEGPGTVGAAPPFWRIDSVAAVASTGWSSAASPLLDLSQVVTAVGLHSVVHGRLVVVVHLGFAARPRPFVCGTDDGPQRIQRAAQILDVAGHF